MAFWIYMSSQVSFSQQFVSEKDPLTADGSSQPKRILPAFECSRDTGGAPQIDGIPGEELFFDHVHPSIEGHRLLALALLETMAEQGLATPGVGWDEAAVERITQEVMDGLDDTARAAALTNESKVLGWAGKLVEAHDVATQGRNAFPNSVGGKMCHNLIVQIETPEAVLVPSEDRGEVALRRRRSSARSPVAWPGHQRYSGLHASE